MVAGLSSGAHLVGVTTVYSSGSFSVLSPKQKLKLPCKRSYPLNTKDTMNNIVARGNKEEKCSSVQWERQEHLR